MEDSSRSSRAAGLEGETKIVMGGSSRSSRAAGLEGETKNVMGGSSRSSRAAGSEGETKNGCTKIFKRGSKFMDEKKEKVIMWLRVIITTLDPFFCYILVAVEDGRCVGFDKKWRTTVVLLRFCVDFLWFILFIYYRNNPSPSPYHVRDKPPPKWGRFLFSTLGALGHLPLPQVMALFVLPNLKGLRFLSAIRAFVCVLCFQNIPRFIGMYNYLKLYGWSTVFPKKAEAKALFNLVLYVLASHVIGALWYLLTIEQKATCWHRQSQHFGLNCNYGNSWVGKGDNFCNPGAEKQVSNAFHNFGIFTDALDVVHSRDFIARFFNCFWWGLQKLSSLGQDLKTNGRLLEIFFAIFITLSGVLLFALLIGNLQAQLQTTFTTLQQMRLIEESIQNCSKRFDFPEDLQKKIRQCKPHKGKPDQDIGQLLRNLPDDICVQITRHICEKSVDEMLSKLRNIKEEEKKTICDGIYDRLKPFAYEKRSRIIKKGAVVDELVFKFGGTVYKEEEDDGKGEAEEGFTEGFWGEELVEYTLKKRESSSHDLIPKSKRTLRAGSEQVEAFVISQKDLKELLATGSNKENNKAKPDPDLEEVIDTNVSFVAKTYKDFWKAVIKMWT